MADRSLDAGTKRNQHGRAHLEKCMVVAGHHTAWRCRGNLAAYHGIVADLQSMPAVQQPSQNYPMNHPHRKIAHVGLKVAEQVVG